MNSKICLIRHGITEGNKNRLYYGHSDIPLAKEGIKELRRLADEGIYPDGSNADFYTSGLKRTAQTLELIYGKHEYEVIADLKEINFGDFEMKSHGELKDAEDYIFWRKNNTEGQLAPPNGESLKEFSVRVVRGFEELKRRHACKVLAARHKSEEAVSIAVCHGGVIAAVMNSICNNDSGNFFKWITDPGHGYVFHMDDYEVKDVERF